VQIRFMLDQSFFKTSPNEANDLANIANIQIKIVDYTSFGGIQHAKYIVVDQHETYLGSANFDWLALTHIHEVGMDLTDMTVISGLESIFEKDWEMAAPFAGNTAAKPAVLGAGAEAVKTQNIIEGLLKVQGGRNDTGFTLVASPASTTPSGIADTLTEIVKRLNAAKTSIKVQVYEYTTTQYAGNGSWTVLDTALRAAAARGVSVQLMVDAVAMKGGKNCLTALARVKNFQVRTVKIPQWSGGPLAYARLIHSKYFVIDGATAWVGSENWIDTYFTGTRNVGVILETPAVANFVSQLDQIYNQVWTSAYTTTL
jgi:phosphatidylserine/phosphatidylglycerophosphate/cardiolipin synthase-like enzyme